MEHGGQRRAVSPHVDVAGGDAIAMSVPPRFNRRWTGRPVSR
jgi:hypothetical protein